MKSGYYSRIAFDSIKKNPRLYIPRILSESGLLGCFYIMLALAFDERLASISGGEYIPTLMWMGAVVLGILSLVLILYINTFLMKQRKSEYGLYNVLGMEKKHIIKVIFSESLFTFVISALLGTALGVLFYKMSSLLICKLLQADIVAGFYYINAKTLLAPVGIFACLDIFAFAVNGISVKKLKPVELLSEKHTGEKEPKVKWVLLIIGVIALGAGYVIALTVKQPLEAIFTFFIAVILVIIGTYCLFITGTTFVLKCLKKNKKYYYSKKHMPSVSGLIFRMKQNAVGLASIAILSTGVLVMISTTVSLYSGFQEVLDANYPQDIYLSSYYEQDGQLINISAEDLEKTVRAAAEKNDVGIADISTEKYLSVSYILENNVLLTKTEINGGWDPDAITNVTFITEDTFKQLSLKKLNAYNLDEFNLGEDEIAYCPIAGGLDKMSAVPESLTINGKDYKIKTTFNSFPIQVQMGNMVFSLGIIVSDEDVLQEIYLAQKQAYGEYASEYTDRISVSFSSPAEAEAVGNQLEDDIFNGLGEYSDSISATLDTKWTAKSSVLGMYGSLFFLGIILGFVCLFSTILIIYYKQISEGYEDRERFQIMQKIGMEKKEVRKTVNSQMILQFFLPLITAGIHTAFAFPILLKLLNILMLTNTGLFLLCTLITYIIFALSYTAVYKLTSRTYFRIVR